MIWGDIRDGWRAHHELCDITLRFTKKGPGSAHKLQISQIVVCFDSIFVVEVRTFSSRFPPSSLLFSPLFSPDTLSCCRFSHVKMSAHSEGKRKSARVPLEKRAKVLDLVMKGQLTETEIAKRAHVTVVEVERIAEKWEKHHTLKDLPRSGRPTKITAKMMHAVRLQVKLNRLSSMRDVQRFLSSRFNVDVCINTVSAAAKRAGLRTYGLARKPDLTSAQKSARVEEAKSGAKV